MAVVPTSKPKCMLAFRLLQYHRYPALSPSAAPELSTPQQCVLITLLLPCALSCSSLLPSPGLFGFLLCLNCHPLTLSSLCLCVCVCPLLSLFQTLLAALSLSLLPTVKTLPSAVLRAVMLLVYTVCFLLGTWPCVQLPWEVGGVGLSLGARVIAGCEPPNKGAGNQT